MSKQYRDFNGENGGSMTTQEMRVYSQRPGRTDKDGNLIYVTEQAHLKECDVNLIIKKFDKSGVIDHVSKFEASFGNLSGIDFKDAQDLIINANNQFDKLPPKIRRHFKNKPENLLTFMEDENNREKAIELGLIDKSFSEMLDGLGEHVTKEQAKIRDKKSEAGDPKNPPETEK